MISSYLIKKRLFISLVRSQLSFCSQLWRPSTFKLIQALEQVQRRATKYILHDYNSSYKNRLLKLHLLPLNYWFDLQDLYFFVHCVKYPVDNFNIFEYVSFTQSSTRASSSCKLKHNYHRCNHTSHFYFNRIVRLWNALPNNISLDQKLPALKHSIYNHLWSHFVNNFNVTSTCSFQFICHCTTCYQLHR